MAICEPALSVGGIIISRCGVSWKNFYTCGENLPLLYIVPEECGYLLSSGGQSFERPAGDPVVPQLSGLLSLSTLDTHNGADIVPELQSLCQSHDTVSILSTGSLFLR